MTNTLFKFLPARIDFFENFLVRATNKSALNDPFEVNPSIDFFGDLSEKTNMTRFGKTKEEVINFIENLPESSGWEELGISLYKDSGIVSLTETKDNLLMWSHYAAEHRGVVVELDMEDEFFHSKYFDESNSHEGKVSRVLYRKERLNELNDYLMEPYFHKSDEWAYEKEHRLLLPLYRADYKLIPKCKEKDIIDKGYCEKSDLTSFNNDLYKIERTNLKGGYLNEGDVLNMFELPKSSIKSITFGCKASEDFISSVISKLKVNNLDAVKLIKASMDNRSYRLKFAELKI